MKKEEYNFSNYIILVTGKADLKCTICKPNIYNFKHVLPII